jgi:hypothetical protein
MRRSILKLSVRWESLLMTLGGLYKGPACISLLAAMQKPPANGSLVTSLNKLSVASATSTGCARMHSIA